MIKYPLAKETINDTDIDNLIEWLKTKPRLTKGELTIKFEDVWAKYIGTKYSVFVNSGSSANLLMIYSLIATGKLKRGDKIIVPSVGWATTLSPVLQFDLTPIMVDADPDNFCLNLLEVEEHCKKGDIKAVLAVHVLGVPIDIEILKLQEKYNFIYLEDGCASLGSEYEDGKKVGSIGLMGTFSFYFGHQLSTIEGGMINTNDFDTYQTLLMLRSHGWGKDLDNDYYKNLMDNYEIDDFNKPFTFFIPGFNVRATDLQSFIGLEQMKKADYNLNRRYLNHLKYAELLKGSFIFQNWKNNKPVSISFGILVNSSEERKIIVKRLIDNNIETRLFSAGNLGLHPFWTKYYTPFHGKFADKIHDTGLFLPNYPELTDNDIEFICDVVKNKI